MPIHSVALSQSQKSTWVKIKRHPSKDYTQNRKLPYLDRYMFSGELQATTTTITKVEPLKTNMEGLCSR